MENLSLFYQDIGTSSSAGGHLTQEEAAKEALAIIIIQKQGGVRWKVAKEEEEAIKRLKGEALKEKDDHGAFIFPIRLEGMVNENALADTGLDINTMRYQIYKTLGREEMKKVGVTTIIAKFLILDIPIDLDAPMVIGWGFLYTIGSILNTPEKLFSTFDGICHQTFRATRFDVLRTAESDSDDKEEYQIKRNNSTSSNKPILEDSCLEKEVSFLGSLHVPLKQVNWKPDYKGCYTKEEEETGQWRTEIRLTDLYGNIYLQGLTTKKTDRKLSKYHKLSDIMSPNWFVE
ncbi:hypothetical protein Tco_0936484 [Tanacetum coccineum]